MAFSRNNTGDRSNGVSFDGEFFKGQGKGAALFERFYGFGVKDILSKGDDGVTRIDAPYTFWHLFPRFPLYKVGSEDRVTINERASIFMGYMGENASAPFSEFSFWPSRVRDDLRIDDYIKSPEHFDSIHPSGIPFYFVGLSKIDHEGNEHDSPVPVSIEITRPGSRVRLYRMMTSKNVFPSMSDVRVQKGNKAPEYLIPGVQSFVTGRFQPYKGFIIGDGMHEGNAPGLASKPRRERA